MGTGIRLKAEDHSDLSAISACLQDAVIKVSDMAFVANSSRFAFVGNRFCWEADDIDKTGQRARFACRFENVLKTSSQNIPLNLGDHVLNFLSIYGEGADDGTATILLLFSGGASIKLEVECIEMYLEDISDTWTTKNTPCHDGDSVQTDDESFKP